MFCPKCGSILMPRKEGNKKVLGCSCGFKEKSGESVTLHEKGTKNKDVEIVDRDDVETLPIMDVECPKCKHRKAYFWTMQTRAGDEPETKFIKCVKCKHTWRDYD